MYFPTSLSLEHRSPHHAGNLTAEETQKLKTMWTRLLTLFEQKGDTIQLPPTKEEEQQRSEKKSSSGSSGGGGGGLFSSLTNHAKKNKKEDASQNYFLGINSDPRWAQYPLEKALPLIPGQLLRQSFWGMVATANPDATVLRFLRARKWDLDQSFNMLTNTLRWRLEMRLDEIIALGETGLIETLEKNKKGLGEMFRKQLNLKMVSLGGPDKEGRGVCFVNVQVHHKDNQPLEIMKLLTLYIMETSRIICDYPMDTVCIVFNLENFTMANMDFEVVKFLVSCFQAYYPETLGLCCVHKAPWVFSTIWSMITPLLDPVVSSKIVFTKSVPDLEQYIDPECLPIIITGDATKPSKDERTKCPLLNPGHTTIPETPDVKAYWDTIQHYEDTTREWTKTKNDDLMSRLELGQTCRIARIKAENTLRGETVYHGKGLVKIDENNRLILDYGTTSWTPKDITDWV